MDPTKSSTFASGLKSFRVGFGEGRAGCRGRVYVVCMNICIYIYIDTNIYSAYIIT